MRLAVILLLLSLVYIQPVFAWPDSFVGSGSLLTSGSDSDSTTVESDSGLEKIGSRITLLRGCDDNQILKWDETDDDWNCEADATGAGGSAITLDIGDDGGNDSVDLTEIATTGDTNSIFTESAADKLLIAVGNNWPTADTANAGDSATAFFSSGTIEHERGGLEADVSGYTDGIYGQLSGSTADIDTISEIETAIGGATNILIETEIDASSELAAIIDDETGTGLIVFGTAPNIQGKVSRTGTAVNDDDCTGEQGSWWWDSTDSAFEWCNANSGAPATLGSGSGDFLADGSVPMTAEIFIDALGAEFEPGDALTDCSTFSATGGGIFYDDSEGIFKKCQDNVLTDLDTNTGSATAYDDIADPDAAGLIMFDDGETATYDGANEDESFFTISLNKADLTADTEALLITAVDNDDANYIPLLIQDDQDGTPDTLFQVDYQGVVTALGPATGAFGVYDAKFGDVTTPDYGAIQIGAQGIYSSSFSAANLNLDKALVFRNAATIGVSNDPGILYAFYDNTGSVIRFAIPESGTGLGTYNPRSMIFAGPYTNTIGNSAVTCNQWSAYDSNLDCDTSGTGADVFIQDDLEVEGTIFAHETINLEGATADGNQVIIQVGADPGADVTLTLPTSTGTIYNSADVPGGELGGTWASPTVDDTGITLTSITIGSLLGVDSIDATGAVDMDYGSNDITDHTFITDGTGTAEIVLPAGSIDGTEILDDTVDSADYAANSIDDEHMNTTGWIQLPVQSAKLSGSFVTSPATLSAASGAWGLYFSGSSTNSAIWQFRAPSNYGGSPIAKILYAMDGNCSSTKVDFEVEVMANADGEDVTSASFDTLNEITGGTSCPATAGLQDSISVTLTNADSLAAGELAIIRVNRDHDDADDTESTANAAIIGLTIEWTE